MSLNNYVLVKEIKHKYLPWTYEVSELDADTNCQFGKTIKCARIREAIIEAQKIETEYGIHFILRKE